MKIIITDENEIAVEDKSIKVLDKYYDVSGFYYRGALNALVYCAKHIEIVIPKDIWDMWIYADLCNRLLYIESKDDRYCSNCEH